MCSAEKVLQFELKYCERCGGLWLRPLGGAAIYCVPCAIFMRELPDRHASSLVKVPA